MAGCVDMGEKVEGSISGPMVVYQSSRVRALPLFRLRRFSELCLSALAAAVIENPHSHSNERANPAPSANNSRSRNEYTRVESPRLADNNNHAILQTRAGRQSHRRCGIPLRLRAKDGREREHDVMTRI